MTEARQVDILVVLLVCTMKGLRFPSPHNKTCLFGHFHKTWRNIEAEAKQRTRYISPAHNTGIVRSPNGAQ